LCLVAFLLVFFVAELSVGMLSYYHALTSTLGILFVLVVFDSLTERVWHDAALETTSAGVPDDRLVARTCHRLIKALALLLAAIAVAALWVDAVGMADAGAAAALRSVSGAAAVLFVAYLGWQLAKLAMEHHLRPPAASALPGEGDEAEIAPATRLQTALPFLRAALAIAIAVLAVLVILSRLGVDTAPLIAGAGVFGLAISFGSQSLVRDIISGLFYMWDDAFRVGEYIDTGRLRGTVEGMSIRSVKLRHHNGPLHTIPYGQLGAVSNLSRDWVILKFNLRLERGSDIELVRKTVKQIGIQMQDDPEIAAEVLQPLKLQGIVEFADTALVVRLKFTARPVKPSWIQREYLKRIYRVFPEKGIAFATGALTLLQASQGLLPTEATTPPLAPVPAAPRVA
jgi:small-conductance mechanosensitive channel